MKRTPFLLVLGGVIAAVVLAGCATSPPIRKQALVTMLEDNASGIICNDERLRACTGLSEQSCKREVSKASAYCSEAITPQWPAEISGAQRYNYGREYGGCIELRLVASGKVSQEQLKSCRS